MRNENSSGKKYTLGLIASIREFGLCNLLLSVDVAVALFSYLGLMVLTSLGWLHIDQKAFDWITDFGLTISTVMLAVTMSSFAIIASLCSDPLLYYLREKKRYGSILFPFYWNAYLWFFLLLIGIILKFSFALGFTGISPYIYVAYLSSWLYALISTHSLVDSVHMFAQLKAEFVASIINNKEEQVD